MNIEDFMKKQKPGKKRSVFDKYSTEIITLIGAGYTQLQVIDFLKKKIKNHTGLS
jgi:hypothetical protein